MFADVLSKPLHKFTIEDLYDLVDDLQHEDWAATENYVMEMVDKAVERWTNERMSGIPSGHAVRIEFHHMETSNWDPNDARCPTSRVSTKRILVPLPTSLPEEFVRPFAERMIREQMGLCDDLIMEDDDEN